MKFPGDDLPELLPECYNRMVELWKKVCFLQEIAPVPVRIQPTRDHFTDQLLRICNKLSDIFGGTCYEILRICKTGRQQPVVFNAFIAG